MSACDPKAASVQTARLMIARCFGRAAFSNPSKFGSSIDLSQGILLVHPHRQGMTSSDEKPNQDKDAAKTKLSHSTGIRPPLVTLANLLRWRSLQAELAKFIIVQGCREPSPVLGLAPGIQRSST